MKNVLKITVVSTLLLVASLLISACGTERFVQGQARINVTVKDSANNPLEFVKIDVRESPGTTGDIVRSETTDSTGAKTFYVTVGSDYYFTFTDTIVPARYVTTERLVAKPPLSEPQALNVLMQAVVR